MTDVIDETLFDDTELDSASAPEKGRAMARAPQTPAAKLFSMLRLGVSGAVVFGVVMWGYQLLEQDASGVPVVLPQEGPTRIAPENPGGSVADNIGLAVNQVLALSGAEAASESVTLAPIGAAFEEGDLLMQSDAEAGEVYREDFAEGTIGQKLAALAVPSVAFDINAAPLEEASTSIEAAELITVAKTVPGVTQAPRPPSRPRVAETAPAPAAAPAAAPAPAATSAVAQGTPLVQLGAFPSPEIAQAEWTRLSRRLPAHFQGRSMIIEKTVNAGREFHRLRAAGFADIAEARRFCTLMEAEKIGCIPTTAN